MRQRVFIPVDGETIVGDLYLPAGPGPHSAALVAGPMTSVKEQVAGVYACALAVRGIAAIAIDHRHFGESGGRPRQWEHPEHKVEDLRAVFDWLGRHPLVEAADRHLVGVCLGAAYAAAAGVDLAGVRSLSTVVGYFPDPHEMRSTNPGFDTEIDTGCQARRHFETTGDVVTVPAAGGSGAPMTSETVIDYYTTRRAAVANYRNEFAVMSRETWLSFDGQAAAPLVATPTLFVHADGALAPHWARRFHDRMTADRRFVLVEPGHQTDFYDDPARVGPAADLVVSWIRSH